MAGVHKVTLEMRFDELGEYASEIWKVLVLLRENRFELKQNATELREDRKMKKNLLFIRAIERVRRRLIYARKCLQARLELLEAENEQIRYDIRQKLGLRTSPCVRDEAYSSEAYQFQRLPGNPHQSELAD